MAQFDGLNLTRGLGFRVQGSWLNLTGGVGQQAAKPAAQPSPPSVDFSVDQFSELMGQIDSGGASFPPTPPRRCCGSRVTALTMGSWGASATPFGGATPFASATPFGGAPNGVAMHVAWLACSGACSLVDELAVQAPR